jgi:hypothetical protein
LLSVPAISVPPGRRLDREAVQDRGVEAILDPDQQLEARLHFQLQ